MVIEASRINFTPPFQEKCNGCKLVMEVVSGEKVSQLQIARLVLTCFPPHAQGENASLEANAIPKPSLENDMKPIDVSQNGPCQVVEKGIDISQNGTQVVT